jgi:uncharacterized protein
MPLPATLPRGFLAAVLFCLSLMFSVVGVAGAAEGEVAVPPLKARITDLTGTLDATQRAALESKLAALEQRKGAQVAVLLVPTTKPESVEQYALRVAEAWKLGRKGVDDGALLLIAKNDRQLRIEVGRGLEGALPDATAKRIIAEFIVPAFKQNNFNGGIDAGVDRVIQVVEGEPLPAPAARPAGRGASSGVTIDDSLTYAGVAVVFLGGILRWIFGTLLGSLIAGVIAGVAATFFGAGVMGGVIIGVIAFVLCLLGISFFGGGSSSSGGGGWSGGGGTFGGGGASGNW